MLSKIRLVLVFFILWNQTFSENKEDYIRSIKLNGNESISDENILPL